MSGVRGLLGLAALAVALVGVGCGSKREPQDLHTPGVKPHSSPTAAATPAGKPVSRTEVAVIRGWADQLRRGHVAAATRYFALPTTVVPDGVNVLVFHTRKEVARFNRGLPCGARLARWQRAAHGFVIATFKLTDRVGSRCDASPGTLAAVAFLIRHGHIKQWLRVPVPAETGAQSSS
jgi:hypothetical protein